MQNPCTVLLGAIFAIVGPILQEIHRRILKDTQKSAEIISESESLTILLRKSPKAVQGILTTAMTKTD